MYSIDIFLIVSFLSFITFLKSGECTWGRVELILLCLFTVDWLLLVIQVSVFSATENPAVGYVSYTYILLYSMNIVVCLCSTYVHMYVHTGFLLIRICLLCTYVCVTITGTKQSWDISLFQAGIVLSVFVCDVFAVLGLYKGVVKVGWTLLYIVLLILNLG